MRLLRIICVFLAISGVFADRRIPGIDALPQAQGDKPPINNTPLTQPVDTPLSNVKQEPTATTVPVTQTQPVQEQVKPVNPDMIRKVRVEPDKDQPHSARITWEVDPSNDTEIYVARFVRPPATRTLVMESENLTTPPLGPKENGLLDRNMPEGSYYYAVVTGYQVSKKGTLILRPDENYTTKPFIVQRKHQEDEPVKQQQTPINQVQQPVDQGIHIQGLTAIPAQTSVKLNWQGVSTPKIAYNVYRGDKPFTTSESFVGAQRLGSVPEDQLNFEDILPVNGKQVFYGVTVQDRATGREYRPLVQGVSFVPFTYIKPSLNADQDSQIPKSLVAYLVSRNTIKLLWVDPAVPVAGYQIYRSSRPIYSTQELDRAFLIGKASGKDGSYTDAGLPTGLYFYAVIPVTATGEQVRLLVSDRTFTGFGTSLREGRIAEVERPTQTQPTQTQPTQTQTQTNTQQTVVQQPEKLEPRMRSLRAKAVDRSTQLSWDAENVVRNDRFLIYRSTEIMRTLNDIRSYGLLVGESDFASRQHSDISLAPGKYYYAVIILHESKAEDKLEPGRHYTTDPVIIKAAAQVVEQTEQISGDIDSILAATYAKDRFEACIQRLLPFLSETYDEKTRAKAILYSGISYFKLGQYRTARKYFAEPVLKKNLPERATFWNKRTIERLP